jgi:ribosome maturation factor RimP
MGFGPFFVCAVDGVGMAIATVVEATLAGMGYELVDAQVSNHGRLVRIFIDRPGGITVDHCAEVSQHLTHVLAVEGIDYDRLEVSSPGLDRPLRKAADFERFSGQRVEVRMKMPDAGGRRKFAGRLTGVADGAATVEVEGRAVSLRLDEIDRARLVPELGMRKEKR